MTQPSNPEYHWTPAQMRAFLEALAESGLISAACESVGKSRRSAYNLRYRMEGRAFAMGWDAALLVARACLADTLMERALVGYTTTSQRDADSGTVTTQRLDNRCAMGMLQRLDRMTGLGAAPEAGSDAALARIIAQDFWHFLELVEKGGQGSEAALFVAARSPAPDDLDAPDCELTDEFGESIIDEDARDTGWGEEPSPEERAEYMRVWRDAHTRQFRTSFPPPLDFFGKENGTFGDHTYSRSLNEDEQNAQEQMMIQLAKPLRTAGELARKRWFGFGPFVPPEIEIEHIDYGEEDEESEAA
jgi:hypothetical protein